MHGHKHIMHMYMDMQVSRSSCSPVCVGSSEVTAGRVYPGGGSSLRHEPGGRIVEGGLDKLMQ
jgi:hypothetical protein